MKTLLDKKQESVLKKCKLHLNQNVYRYPSIGNFIDNKSKLLNEIEQYDKLNSVFKEINGFKVDDDPTTASNTKISQTPQTKHLLSRSRRFN